MARGKPKPLRTEKNAENAGNLIVVEGADDFYAIGHLCDIHGVFNFLRLEEAGTLKGAGSSSGYETLRASIDIRIAESGLKAVGFIADADDNCDGRWQSLRDVLISDLCGYTPENVPLNPDPAGTVIVQMGKPKVGIWLMPDNQTSGALEIFLRAMVPPDDLLWKYAEECVTGLPIVPSAERNWTNKAVLHTWLAWRKDTPGKPIGQAVTSRDFNPYAENSLGFVDWLRRLFELPAA